MLNDTRPTEAAAVVAALDPQSVVSGATVSSPWVSARDFAAFLAVVTAGAVTGTLSVKVQQAKAADGTGTKDVPGAAITPMAVASSNKQALINVRADHLDINADFEFVRVTATAAGGAALISALLFGFAARELPASKAGAASVVEIVG